MGVSGRRATVVKELLDARNRIAELEMELAGYSDDVRADGRVLGNDHIAAITEPGSSNAPIFRGVLQYQRYSSDISARAHTRNNTKTESSTVFGHLTGHIQSSSLDALQQHIILTPQHGIASRLVQAVEQAGMAVVLIDVSSATIQYRSDCTRDIVPHLLLQSMRGKAYSNEDVYAADRSEIEFFLKDCQSLKASTAEYRLSGEEGRQNWLRVSAQPLINCSNEVSHLALISVDVSEEMENLHKLHTEKECADNANRAKSQFLAGMSHEIRNPLNGLLGLLDLLENTELTDRQHKYIKLANISGESLLSLISDVLDCEKIEAGRCEVSDQEFLLREVVADSLAIFSALADSKGISLKSRIDENIPQVLTGDKVKIRQILLNLIGNGLKFTLQGVVTVEVSELPTGNADEIFLLFVVADTGIGIPDNELHHVFEEYTQVAEYSSSGHSGTGLGLSIVRNLVGVLGGTLAVESTQGYGTSVYFTARLKQSEHYASMTTEANLEQLQHEVGEMKVLLAEDDTINRLIGGSLLEKMGHQVIYAENGKDVLQILHQEIDVDCILMDIQMPQMDGIEAAYETRKLYSRRCLSPVPIIALTAHAMEGDRERFLAAGMDEYITKPYNASDLERVLGRISKKCKYPPLRLRRIS